MTLRSRRSVWSPALTAAVALWFRRYRQRIDTVVAICAIIGELTAVGIVWVTGDLSQTSSVMVATFGIVLLVHDVRTTPFILGLGLTAWILAVAQLDNPFRSRWLLDLLALDGLIIPPEHRSAHLAGLAHWRSGGEGPILGRTIENVESEAGNRSLFRAQIGLVVGDLPPRPACALGVWRGGAPRARRGREPGAA